MDYGRLADGPGGEARLTAYRLMRQPHGDFPWSTVVADVRRRDYRSQAALEVCVKVDASARYGFVLHQPCGSFEWKPDTFWVTREDSTAVSRGPPPGGRDNREGAGLLSFRFSSRWR